MKWWKKFLVAALAATVLCLPKSAAADRNDFVVNDFYARYELFNDIHGGRMTVEETIKVTFSDQNHGILRALPKSYKNQSLRLRIASVERDGTTEPYSTYAENDNEVLKIGDADKTITGEHTYEIQYEMSNVISFYDGYDEWNWDINGDQWKQPFQKVGGEVILPEGWDRQGLPSASCYTGQQGSTQSVCTIEPRERGYVFRSTKPLGPRSTLTVATPVQKGLFQPRTTADWFRDNAWQFVGLLTGAGLSAIAFRQWWRFGKDYDGKGTIVPEFQPPKHLSPAEVGILADYNLDNRDLSATIIDLAVRGYIIIHDDEKKSLGLFKRHEFSLELAKSNFAGLKPHEKQLLEALFKPAKKGKIQYIKDINKTKMSKTVSTIRKELKTSLQKEHGLIEETPGKAKAVLWAIGLVPLALAIIIRPGWGWITGAVLAAGSALLFGLFMRRRSHAGVETYEHIKGLKWYMETAEQDRFDKMQSVERPYAEPARSAKLFEKLLPYAVALGVEKSWAKQFDNIYTEPPGWYAGNYAAFSTAYMASSLTNGVSAMSTTFSQSTSSGSSGSGGGGFAGGGGGGGGGGGW